MRGFPERKKGGIAFDNVAWQVRCPTINDTIISLGEETGSAWKSDNKRTSGNRVLYHSYRQDADRFFVLG